jgi:hypothetical protein
MIPEFLKAAGISRVIWIDDFFAPPLRDSLENGLRQAFLRKKETGDQSVEITGAGEIDLTVSRLEIEERSDEIFASLSDEDLRAAADSLNITNSLIEEVPQDLPRESFEALRLAFGKTLLTFSLAEWTSKASRELETAGVDTLFLIDKQFTREKTAYDGVNLLQDLTQGDALCILLTYTCSESGQNDERVGIAKRSGGILPSYKFAVLSKQRSGEGDAVQQFARAIYAVLTHRYTREIAETVRNAIESSALQTAESLSDQSVFELDIVFFENSHREGVPEFDVIVRIFNIDQRYALNAGLRQAALQEQLQKARKFRTETASIRAQWPKPTLDMQKFRDWRRREVFEDGVGLNAIHAPLACGDVFAIDVGDERKKYVFLAQPCDLMIRDDGQRNAEMGLFVLVIDSPTGAVHSEIAGHRFFEISGVFEVGQDWRVDFRNTAVVDISVVDLAVFNSDGRVQLEKDQREPQILLPTGWLKRLKRAKRQFFDNAKAPAVGTLGFGRLSKITAPTIAENVVEYPVQRIGRLENNTATAILAAWATFQTRAALEHDFAQLRPVSKPSRPPPSFADFQRRAYEISEERRRAGGSNDSLADWYQAERELSS